MMGDVMFNSYHNVCALFKNPARALGQLCFSCVRFRIIFNLTSWKSIIIIHSISACLFLNVWSYIEYCCCLCLISPPLNSAKDKEKLIYPTFISNFPNRLNNLSNLGMIFYFIFNILRSDQQNYALALFVRLLALYKEIHARVSV